MGDVEELARFACPSSPPRPPPSHPSRTIPVRTKDPRAHPPDAQLVLLSKCVACGLHWTSRKSAKQKRTHIEQCAKKNALTKDTVRFLIQKETAPAALPNRATATLMDSVIPAGPVKKPRHQQVVPTIRSLPETRESILHRARDILGPTSVQDDPLSTQQFGQSALARRKSQHPRRPALADTNGFTNEAPLTQAFGASSLRAGSTTAERSREQSSLPTLQFGTSMFDQDSILSNHRVSTFELPVVTSSSPSTKQKRPASPPLVASGSAPMRRRLQ